MKTTTDKLVFHKFKVQAWRRAVGLDAFDVNLSNGRMPFRDTVTISSTDALSAARIHAKNLGLHWTEWEEGQSPKIVIRVEQVMP